MELQASPAIPPFVPGAEIGPYRLLRSLGRGGMAEVFMAEHRHLAQLRAIKLLLPHVAQDPRLAARLLTEARAIARLQHPAIVQVFECDTLPGGGAFIAMAYLRGEPANRWLTRIGSLRRHPRLAAAMVGVVADALAHAHRNAVVHRDVKPDNLFLVPEDSGGRRFSVKVLDFGVAKLVGDTPMTATRTGCVVGTPPYMAPEQWQPNGAVGPATDIYSLGCVLFELLVGRPPYIGDDPLAIMGAHLVQETPRARRLVRELPAELDRLIARMLAKAPDQRPGSMDEVATALEAFLGCERARFGDLLCAPDECPVTASRTLDGEPLPPPAASAVAMAPVPLSATQLLPRPHRPVRLALVAAACVATVVVGAGLVVRWGHRTPPAATAARQEPPTPPALAPPRTPEPALAAPRAPEPTLAAPAPERAEARAAPSLSSTPTRAPAPADPEGPASTPVRRPARHLKRAPNVYLPVGD